jgi:hypothetical protein
MLRYNFKMLNSACIRKTAFKPCYYLSYIGTDHFHPQNKYLLNKYIEDFTKQFPDLDKTRLTIDGTTLSYYFNQDELIPNNMDENSIESEYSSFRGM